MGSEMCIRDRGVFGGVWVPNEPELLADTIHATSTGIRYVQAGVSLGLQATGNRKGARVLVRSAALSGLIVPGVYGDVATWTGHLLRSAVPGPVGEVMGLSHEAAGQVFGALDIVSGQAGDFVIARLTDATHAAQAVGDVTQSSADKLAKAWDTLSEIVKPSPWPDWAVPVNQASEKVDTSAISGLAERLHIKDWETELPRATVAAALRLFAANQLLSGIERFGLMKVIESAAIAVVGTPARKLGQAIRPRYRPWDPQVLRRAAQDRAVWGQQLWEDRVVEAMQEVEKFRQRQRVILAEREAKYLEAADNVGNQLMLAEDEFNGIRAVRKGIQGMAGAVWDSLNGEADWLVETSNIFHKLEPTTPTAPAGEVADNFLLPLIQTKETSPLATSQWMGVVRQARRSDEVALETWDRLNAATAMVREDDGIVAVEPRLAPEGVAERLRNLPETASTVVGALDDIAPRAATTVGQVRALYRGDGAQKSLENLTDIQVRAIGKRVAKRLEKLRTRLPEFASGVQYLAGRKALLDLEEFHRFLGRGGGDIQTWASARKISPDTLADLKNWDRITQLSAKASEETDLTKLSLIVADLETVVDESQAVSYTHLTLPTKA